MAKPKKTSTAASRKTASRVVKTSGKSASVSRKAIHTAVVRTSKKSA